MAERSTVTGGRPAVSKERERMMHWRGSFGSEMVGPVARPREAL